MGIPAPPRRIPTTPEEQEAQVYSDAAEDMVQAAALNGGKFTFDGTFLEWLDTGRSFTYAGKTIHRGDVRSVTRKALPPSAHEQTEMPNEMDMWDEEFEKLCGYLPPQSRMLAWGKCHSEGCKCRTNWGTYCYWCRQRVENDRRSLQEGHDGCGRTEIALRRLVQTNKQHRTTIDAVMKKVYLETNRGSLR